MSKSPEISWLMDRWGLPKDEIVLGNVQNLLKAEREEGDTAVRIVGSGDWGQAAAEPEAACDSPLVLLGNGEYLQSRRCYLAEKSVAERIRRLASVEETAVAKDVQSVSAFFPESAEGDLQVEAARTALRRRLTIITGGPGTGKTYTLARILALLVEGGQQAEFIRLAAPTGKAADRMRAAVEKALEQLSGVSEETRRALHQVAAHSSTLHSLLGYNPARPEVRHPLGCEVLIVDECSMVDVFLWSALLEALPEGTRLILLGDPAQLQSVGQGDVFGTLVDYAREEGSGLHGCLLRLTESRRFRDRPGIHRLAEVLEAGDEKAAEVLLRSAADSPEDGLIWIETNEPTVSYERFPIAIQSAVEEAACADSPQGALEALKRVCILTAHRRYFLGAEAVGRNIAHEMVRRRIGPVGRMPNEPVIIAVNDAETGLRNGSVGILHTDNNGKRMAWFPEGSGLRAYPLGGLPEYGSAWAITIHRSQGSEYDNVLVLLPRGESPLSTRELVYTAVTRARSQVMIVGSMDAMRTAVQQSSRRVSLLRQALKKARDTVVGRGAGGVISKNVNKPCLTPIFGVALGGGGGKG